MMYKKIEEVQKRKDSSNSLRVNNYSIKAISGCKGYEILMNGIRNYTRSKVYLCTFPCKERMFIIDIDCKNSKDKDILKLFNALKDSTIKTLTIH